MLHSPWVARTPLVEEGVGHGAEGSWLEGHGCVMAGQLTTPQVHQWPALLPHCVPARSHALHMHTSGTQPGSAHHAHAGAQLLMFMTLVMPVTHKSNQHDIPAPVPSPKSNRLRHGFMRDPYKLLYAHL